MMIKQKLYVELNNVKKLALKRHSISKKFTSNPNFSVHADFSSHNFSLHLTMPSLGFSPDRWHHCQTLVFNTLKCAKIHPMMVIAWKLTVGYHELLIIDGWHATRSNDGPVKKISNYIRGNFELEVSKIYSANHHLFFMLHTHCEIYYWW